MGQTQFSDGGSVVLRGIARWEIRDRAQGARQSVVTTAQACISRMAASVQSGEAREGKLAVAHELCQQLKRFVNEYAHILSALGHDAVATSELTVQAVRDAVADGEPPAELVSAVREWSLAAAPRPADGS